MDVLTFLLRRRSPAPRSSVFLTALRSGTLALVLAAGWAYPAHGQASESELKAAFLFNFGRYVRWPEMDPPPPEGDPFLICSLGDPEIFDALQAVVQKRTVQGRPVQINIFQDPDGIGVCDILYVADSQESRIGNVLDAVRGRPILTVAGIERFAEVGGMIRLFAEADRPQLEINPSAAEEEGLRLSARLLDLAQIVGGDRRPRRRPSEPVPGGRP